MSKTKIKILILIVISITVIVISIIYEREISRNFKQKESFNYQSIEIGCIEVIGRNKGGIKIEKIEDIVKILNYLNSLELIKEKSPNYNTQKTEDSDKIGYFRVIFNPGRNFNDVVCDAFTFKTDYITVHNKGYDYDYTDYYIVDSGYNPKDQSSNFSVFLDEILIKYIE